MQRTVLVTLAMNKITKETREFYGRYDPVTMEKNNWKIVETYKQMYEMTDECFAKNGTKKGDKIL